jgi:hypothetical protein
MKLKYRDLSEDIQQNTIVSYEKLSKEARAVREKQSMNFMKFLQKEKLKEKSTKYLLPMRASSPTTKKEDENTGKSVSYDMSMSFLKSARVTLTINNKLDKRSLMTSKDFINAQPQKNEITHMSHDFSSNQNAHKFQHSRLGSLTSNASNYINQNFSSTYIDSESKMSNHRMSQSRTSSRYGYKRKIFEDELGKKVDDKEIEVKKEYSNCMGNNTKSEEQEIVKNKKLRMNLKNWQKTSFNKTKTPFNTGSFNLPLYVFKNGDVK